jgi:hypothetical protein
MEGSTAGRLLMFYEKVIKLLYKTEHKKNATKTANEPISIEK